ncbi:MAG: hypothetical protein ABIR80_14800, partial [Opitutaceae bacterium]
MLQFHTSTIPDLRARVQQGRALVQILAEGLSTQGEPHNLELRHEIRLVQRSSDYYFLHEFLEGE